MHGYEVIESVTKSRLVDVKDHGDAITYSLFSEYRPCIFKTQLFSSCSSSHCTSYIISL